MSTRSMKAMQSLSRFGELAWFSLPAEIHPVYGYLQVPYMGWRYKAPSEEISQVIEDSVNGLTTQVEWKLDTTRRNWLLLPSRILHEAGGLENPAFAEVVHFVNTRDQNFCRIALSDLDLIIGHMQEVPASDN